MSAKKLILAASVLLAAAPAFAARVDSDRDGIKDRKDACASTPVGARVDRTGCPTDADADGVADGIDRCSRTPQAWPVDATGCPADGDADQVADGADACAGTPRNARVDARGCPWDTDADQVLEGLDRCDGTPAGYTVDRYGCPVDGDHDGVNDSLDRCPESLPREAVDAEGCRIKASPIFSEGTETVRLEGVNFEKGKIEVSPEADAALRGVAASLKDWPETRVEIAVHTDAKGNSQTNKELSDRRAQYLASYLTALGVEPERVTAKGYGESRRLAERTVELKVVR